MKATEQYFPVVLSIMLYKVGLTFESVDEILWSDHSNESYCWECSGICSSASVVEFKNISLIAYIFNSQ